ncbi:sigma-70 family RNA polymerase sigma factor [Corallococcus sp. CA053C]|uniref:RNA polymerase sigma factor n=1 Tax=Corallococcus sp. CA053C TaxID=2316732 RepID=UPI000EA07FCA|nr:sigma-70 family RNA polymerase sigma factor [Corallococcus sp. CA053C]RKH08924.1 sigma-70 family RNA polymerase sigma factor [Corallococcus sp. CA053C]
MNSPSRKRGWDLHERMMSHDSTATFDVFMTFMGPLIRALERNLGCSYDEANACAADAVYAYVRHPERFDASKASLSTFLTQIAKHKAQDSYRSSTARNRREQDPRTIFEVHPPAPNISLEERVDIKQRLDRLVQRIEGAGLPERDLAGIRVIFAEERCSMESMAEALGLSHLPQEEMRQAVRRHTDRLKKILKRLCKEDLDDES